MTEPTAVHIREILFASDFSPYSDHAFGAALTLAQHFGARLHLFHVVHHAREAEAAQVCLDTLARQRGAAVPIVVATATGHPAEQIVKHAQHAGVDLIVMGTHGRTGLAHVARGSVAESVVRHAHCLVLTIGKAAELRVDVAEAPAEARGTASRPVGRTGLCLVCARPSEDLVCEGCKSRIRAEAAYLRSQDEKAAR